ncbi:ROK family protein [Paenibacillus sepulcri]|uniref:ROK family protein n=1 Tax=Paenibacillus sepulcri TaxID=359917 RepID=A0ABS7C0S7_9BACL|nr:ROK family protein [Paenibacillus sepulcri]
MKKVTQQQIKQANMETVFRLIQTSKGASRASLSKVTQLSPTTISTIVDDLIKKSIVVESALIDNPGAGRKAITLEINNGSKYLIGMELNELGVTGTIYNLKNDPFITKTLLYNKKNHDKDEFLRLIVDLVRMLVDAVPDKTKELLGICIGVPGMLDSERRSIVVSTPLLIKDMEIINKLSLELPYPVYMENESLLAAIAEKEHFKKTTGPFIYLNVNKGLGVSIMINDKPMLGVSKVFPEIGHMSLDVNGPLCPCGNRGCFETMVSLTALTERTLMLMPEYKDSVLHKLTGSDPEKINELVIAQAVKLNDPLALAVVQEISRNLAYGIVNLINIFNPEVIVIGGRLSHLGEVLLASVVDIVHERALAPFSQACSIFLSRLNVNNVSAGASLYVLNKVLEEQI